MKHEKREAGGGVVARASGGSLPHGAEIGDIKDRGHREIKVTRRHGGKVEHESKAEEKREEKERKEKEEREHKHRRRRGGKVEGEAPRHANHHRARGGRMSPSEPLSGATAENASYISSKGPKEGPKGLVGG